MPLSTFEFDDTIPSDDENNSLPQQPKKIVVKKKTKKYTPINAAAPLTKEQLLEIAKKNKREPSDYDLDSEYSDDDVDNSDNEVSIDIITKLLSCLSDERCDNEYDWVRVGWCIRNSVSDDKKIQAFKAWDKWSRNSNKYNEDVVARKWDENQNYNGPKLGIGSLYAWAKEDNEDKYNELFPKKTLTISCNDNTYEYQKSIFEHDPENPDIIRCFMRVAPVPLVIEFNTRTKDYKGWTFNNACTVFAPRQFIQIQNQKEQTKDFLPAWNRDGTKLTFQDFVNNPDPEFNDKTVINLWKGFIWEKDTGDYVYDCSGLEMILDLLYTLCDNDDEVADYICKWISHIFNYPHLKAGCCPIFISDEKGIGKSMFITFLKKLIGEDLVADTTPESVFGKHNDPLEKSFLIVLDELEFKKGAMYAQFKRHQTETDHVINLKYGRHGTMKMYHRWIGTTNNFDCLPFEENQRRELPIVCGTKYYRNKTFFAALDKLYNDRNFMLTAFHFFKNYPTESFIGIFPVTRQRKINNEYSIRPEKKWFYDFIASRIDLDKEQISNFKLFTSDAHKYYNEYVTEHINPNCCKAQQTLSKTIKSIYQELFKDGHIIEKKKDGGARYWLLNIPEIYAHLQQKQNIYK